MERNGMTEMAMRQSYWWWFDSHSNSPSRSQWLQSTLSELDERTQSMLMIIDQEADSFAQRAEMYYKKRPQLISLIEDFYRTHRSLAVQFDHLKQDPATRRTSSLVRSFSLPTDEPEKAIMGPRKSYDGCFTKPAYDSDSDSIDSEVDDPIPEVNYDLMAEIDRLKEDAMIQKRKLAEKEKAMEEMKWKLDEACNEVMELKEETEKLRLENVELYHLKMKDDEEKERLRMNLMEEREQLIAENERQKQKLEEKDNLYHPKMKDDEEKERLRMNLMEEREQLIAENESQKQKLEEKDNEKREVIRQLSLAIEMLKNENLVIKKLFANESVKKWNPFDQFQGLKGFQKPFKNCLTVRADPFFL